MKPMQTALLAAGTCLLTITITPRPAYAFGEAAIVFAINAMKSFLGKEIEQIGGNITRSLNDMTDPNSVASLIRDSATQAANYSKGQVVAQSHIADAANTAMAAFLRQQHDTDIRDQHTMNPEFCSGLDEQQATQAAARSSRSALGAITLITDQRGEAGKGSPSYYGQAQGVTAATNLHLRRYCSPEDVEAGLCTSPSRFQNADQRAGSLFGTDTLTADGGLDAANDYGTTLIQPVAPAALRGDQATTTSGREAFLERRAYNARMSLARYVIGFITSLESPSVTLTSAQKTEMQSEGITPLDKASWLQAMSLEVNRRMSSVQWNASLQSMAPAAVEREIASELAQSNYLAMQNYRLGLFQASLSATRVAQTEEQKQQRRFASLPSPSINP